MKCICYWKWILGTHTIYTYFPFLSFHIFLKNNFSIWKDPSYTFVHLLLNVSLKPADCTEHIKAGQINLEFSFVYKLFQITFLKMKILAILLLVCGFTVGLELNLKEKDHALNPEISNPDSHWGAYKVTSKFQTFRYKLNIWWNFPNLQLKFHRKYKNADHESNSRKVFLKNLARIQKHNKDYEDGKEHYKMEVGEYTDMDFEQFVKTRTGAKVTE